MLRFFAMTANSKTNTDPRNNFRLDDSMELANSVVPTIAPEKYRLAFIVDGWLPRIGLFSWNMDGC